MRDYVTIGLIGSGDEIPVAPGADYGLYLQSYDAPLPPLRTQRVEIEGRNGSIDMTEWAGMTFYDDRSVEVVLRGKGHTGRDLAGRLIGQRCRIYLDVEELRETFFVGRCEDASLSHTKHDITRKWETEMTLKFTCHPFRYPAFSDDDYAPGAGGQAYSGRRALTLSAATGATGTATRTLHQGELSTPVITIAGMDETENGTCTLTVNGTDYVIQANGTMDDPPVLRPGSNTMSLANSGYSGTITAEIAFMDRVI